MYTYNFCRDAQLRWHWHRNAQKNNGALNITSGTKHRHTHRTSAPHKVRSINRSPLGANLRAPISLLNNISSVRAYTRRTRDGPRRLGRARPANCNALCVHTKWPREHRVGLPGEPPTSVAKAQSDEKQTKKTKHKKGKKDQTERVEFAALYITSYLEPVWSVASVCARPRHNSCTHIYHCIHYAGSGPVKPSRSRDRGRREQNTQKKNPRAAKSAYRKRGQSF